MALNAQQPDSQVGISFDFLFFKGFSRVSDGFSIGVLNTGCDAGFVPSSGKTPFTCGTDG